MEYIYNSIAIFNLEELGKQVIASAMTDKAYQYCTHEADSDTLYVYFENTLSAGDKTILDSIINDGDLELDSAKNNKKKTIDAKTDELILNGFTYDSTVFSLSLAAQSTWTGMFSAQAYLTYPMAVSTLSSASYSLADATAVTNFYLTGVGTIEAVLGSGRSLKVAVNACTTIAEVNAIVDPR